MYGNFLGRPRTQVLYGRIARLLRKQIRIDEIRDGCNLRSSLCLDSVCARSSGGYMVPIRIVLILVQVHQFLMSNQEISINSILVRDALECGGPRGGRSYRRPKVLPQRHWKGFSFV